MDRIADDRIVRVGTEDRTRHHGPQTGARDPTEGGCKRWRGVATALRWIDAGDYRSTIPAGACKSSSEASIIGDSAGVMKKRQRTGKVRRWKAGDGFRWQAIASNGETVSGSTEGYQDKRDRETSIELTVRILLPELSAAALIDIYGTMAHLIKAT